MTTFHDTPEGRDEKIDLPTSQLPTQNSLSKGGQRVIVIGFITIFIVLIGLYSAYFYTQAHDPSKALIYYPETETKHTSPDGKSYTVTNIFSSYDNADFFHEKKSTNYKTMKSLIGKPLDMTYIRDTYQFSIIQSSSDDVSVSYGVQRYKVFVNGNTVPACIIYVNTMGTIVGVTGPYLVKADFRDMTLNGANMTELTRLDNFMNDPDKSHTSFTRLASNLYVASAIGKQEKVSNGQVISPVYVATFHTVKPADSIADFIDYYTAEENFLNVEFSTFINDSAFDTYQKIIMSENKE